MRTIHKYPLGDGGVQGDMLTGKVVHVGHDPAGQACIWVDGPDDEARWRRFQLRGTGHQVGDNWTHVGTFVEGPFTWHVYENPEAVA